MKPRLFYDRDLAIRQEQVACTPDMVVQRQRVRAALKLRPGERVLEVGCGNGFMASEMAIEVGADGCVEGVDISPTMVALAEATCHGVPNARFSIADATVLPFDDSSFDAVAVVQCLCFVNRVEAALAEIFRVLQPGGRAVILDTDWDTLVWNSSSPALMDKVMAVYKSIYTDARLPRILSKALRSAAFQLHAREQFALLNWNYDPNSYSGHQISFTRQIADGHVPETELDAWAESIGVMARNDEYFFSLNRYIFTAIKPT
jgi:ubiquinone/menaquinone biosynthesis C-methylase UbiE